MQTTCPAPEHWMELLSGNLAEIDQAALNAHLEDCPRCQSGLGNLVADRDSWASVARHLAEPEPPAEESLQAVVARLTDVINPGDTSAETPVPQDESLSFLDPAEHPESLGQFGPYQVLELLGQGGMGIVLRAFDPTLERTVAIKVLAPQLAALPTARQRFLREARAAACIDHKHVVAIYTTGEAKGLPYLVMPCIAGRSLQQLLDTGESFSVQEILRIGKEAAEGLAAAHEQGLVHRDVKPGNILLEGTERRVRLTDFGLARAMDEPAVTGSGLIAGTPQYMAPEQARGEPVDHRGDLFSLGSLLYALCTGRAPFEGSSPLIVLRRVSDEPPPPIPTFAPHIPGWLVEIIERLQTKDPADRYSSAAEVAALLGQHQEVVPDEWLVPVIEDEPSPRPQPRRRAKLAALGVAVVVMMGLAGLVLALWGKKQQPEEKEASSLSHQVKGILESHCHRCHGKDGSVEGGFNYLLDRDQLVAHNKVVPGEPDRSPLLTCIIEHEMPPEGEPRPSRKEINLLRRWIKESAPPFQEAIPRPFVSPVQVAQAIDADLNKRGERDQRFTRYFTLTHLHNAGLSEDELETYRHGVSKLINSLSWGKRIVVPVPIDPARTILRIDLREYGWTEEVWESLLAEYPYDTLAEMPGDEEPGTSASVRGDWFVATAARPPLYHQLLQLPDTEEELEQQLRVNVIGNIRGAKVARAGFNGSAVSRNNRIIERHESIHGAYWKSYDFSGNDSPQNIFERPLGPQPIETPPASQAFQHAGGEIIFNLPNGLQGYLIVDGSGKRLDRAPTSIVSDPRRPDRAVETALSCMSCHSQGILFKRDQIRAHVLKNRSSFSREEVSDVEALYPSPDKFQKLVAADARRFREAVAKAGGRVGKTEPIMALAGQFERELDLERAAAEVGLEPGMFRDRLRQNPDLGRTLGALLVKGGTVHREVFTEAFQDLMATLAADRFPGREARPRIQVGLTSPAAGLPGIPAPRLARSRLEVLLPEPFAQVRTGGAGRYLIFHLPKAKKLAIFDVAQARVVEEIDLPATDILYTAGLEKLLIVLPGLKVVQRYSLKTFRREKTATIPGEQPVRQAVMGSAGTGPLLLWSGGPVELWDIEEMRPVDLEGKPLSGDPHWEFRISVSADGKTFVGWHNGISGQQYGVMQLEGKRIRGMKSPDAHTFNEHWALPGPIGSLFFRHGGGMYTGEMRIIASDSFEGAVLLPTEDPRFFLSLRPAGKDRDQVTIHTNADRRPIHTISGIEKTTSSILYTRWGLANLEPRVRFLPSARVLLTLPESNDRVVVRKLDLREALTDRKDGYLFVRSVPPFRVRAEDMLRHRIEVESSAGGVRFTLEAGPEGMTVSRRGQLRWKVPANLGGKTARAALTIKDARGKEIVHAFEVAVLP
jgi:mono/diheme cytochrome c family protein